MKPCQRLLTRFQLDISAATLHNADLNSIKGDIDVKLLPHPC